MIHPQIKLTILQNVAGIMFSGFLGFMILYSLVM